MRSVSSPAISDFSETLRERKSSRNQGESIVNATFARTAALPLGLAAIMLPAPALAAPLDLNAFFADSTVEITADGSMAILSEDPEFSSVRLELDPGLGDPNLIIPRLGSVLRFDFDFVEPGSNNVDTFVTFLLDAATGSSLGGMFEFTAEESEAGSIAFELSPFVGQIIGLRIALIAADEDATFDSTLKISNVRVDEDPDGETPVIPEAGTVSLLLGGLALMGLRRRIR